MKFCPNRKKLAKVARYFNKYQKTVKKWQKSLKINQNGEISRPIWSHWWLPIDIVDDMLVHLTEASRGHLFIQLDITTFRLQRLLLQLFGS